MKNKKPLKKLNTKLRIVVLGSTGSIGTQTLEVIKKHKNKFKVIGLVCHHNKKLLLKQAKEFRVKNIVLASACPVRSAHPRRANFKKLYRLIRTPTADIIVNAISGAAGLNPSIEAIKAGKTLALANKESIVLEGAKLCRLAKKHRAIILPLDSEHHAVARILKTQDLKKYDSKRVKKIILTCSGGPFYGFTNEKLKKVTPKEALKNPNWKMGPKILIESATLLNKGFELIEAHHLFSCPLNKLDAIIDRKSFIHAIVEFKNPQKTLALAYKPDMRTVIEDTLLNYPAKNKKLKFLTDRQLKTYPFKKIDHKTFPAIRKTLAAYKKGQIKNFYKQSEKNIEAFLNPERNLQIPPSFGTIAS